MSYELDVTLMTYGRGADDRRESMKSEDESDMPAEKGRAILV